MADIKDKLMGLIWHKQDCGLTHNEKGQDFVTYNEELADHLIANGVTIQKWIPKKEPPKDSGDYLVSLVAGCGRYETVAYFNGKWWVSRGTDKRLCLVTHWMPLPEPPKGE